MRESAIFYRSFYEAIKDLPSENQVEVYTAIFEYALNFKELELSGISKTIFTLVKPQIQANNKKYKIGKLGGEYGKLGGRGKKRNGKETPYKPQEAISETPNENANVNDNDKENVNINEKVNENVNAPSGEEASHPLQQFVRNLREVSCIKAIRKFPLIPYGASLKSFKNKPFCAVFLLPVRLRPVLCHFYFRLSKICHFELACPELVSWVSGPQ